MQDVKYFEFDFHDAEPDKNEKLPYWKSMDNVYVDSLNGLIKAQQDGNQYELFTHGWSTSRLGKTTSRSQVRKLMKSPDATPYIIRSQCIQHDSVFVAAIKPMKS